MPSLKQELSSCNYGNKRRVEDDVNDALRKYTQLRTSKAQELGTNKRATVLYLIGTIPVTIQGTVYNIPISICIPSTYPYCKPEASVKPTDNMSIAPSHPNVDSYGRIILNYLSTWNPSSNLVGAIDSMVSAFSLCSPLYAKPKTPAPPPSGYPPQPAYSGYGAYPPQQPPAAAAPGGYPPQGPYGGYGAYPPQQPQQPAGYPPQSPYGQPQQQQPVAAGPAGYPPQGPYGQPMMPQVASGVREREIICERLREKSNSIISTTSTMEVELKSIESESKKIMTDVSAGEEKIRELEQNISRFRDENENIERWIGENDKKGRMTMEEIDSATQAQDALEKQKIDVMATDAAIDDVIYALDKAIKDGIISLDEYLKLIRKYSSEQYYAKALANKINAALYHY